MRFTTSAATAVAVLLPTALAQTFTDCNPLEKSCPKDLGLNSGSYTVDFTQGAASNKSWSAAAYTTIDYTSEGAVFSIGQKGQAPTIETDFYVFGGRVDVVMKAAPGRGIVSSIVLESDDLDEIDWEFVGGVNNQVQSNFFGKGNTATYDRAEYHTVQDTQGTWHTYSVQWSKDQLQWIIDGAVIRTLPYSNSLTSNGKYYPQTPMRLKLGNWPGGDSTSQGTVDWAGGAVEWSKAPFNMIVKSVSITNANPACEYKYSDNSGSWDSIDIITTGCTVSGPSSNSTSGMGSSMTAGTNATSATSAPTSSHAVEPASNTEVAVSSTITGLAAPTGNNTAANSGFMSQPTAGVNGTSTSTGSGAGNIPSGPAATTSNVAASEGGAALNSAMFGGSLFSILVGLLVV